MGTVRDPDRFSTVRKCRTNIQCQLNKADRPDTSAKEFVLCSSASLTFVKTARVNTTKWLDACTACTEASVPEETVTWDDVTNMPSSEFPSDGALVMTCLQANARN